MYSKIKPAINSYSPVFSLLFPCFPFTLTARLWGLCNLNATLFTRTTRNGQHTFPFSDLIHRPGRRSAFKIGIGVFPTGTEKDRLREAFFQHIVKETVSHKT